jgi:hypothetical protein
MTQRIRKTHGSGAQRGHECVEKDVGNIAAAAVARRQARRGQGPGSGLVGRGPEVILGRCDSDGREQRRRRAVGEEVALGVLIVTARPPVSHGRQRQGVHELPGAPMQYCTPKLRFAAAAAMPSSHRAVPSNVSTYGDIHMV